MKHALDGIRVLDMTQVMADLFFAMHLCDMGADVIKVEPRGGDTSREVGRCRCSGDRRVQRREPGEARDGRRFQER